MMIVVEVSELWE